jgi:hypothetical protein
LAGVSAAYFCYPIAPGGLLQATALFAQAASEAGATPRLVQHVSHVAQDYRDGIFAGVNNLVEVISASTPMTVEDYVTATRDEFDNNGYYALTDARLAATTKSKEGVDQCIHYEPCASAATSPSQKRPSCSTTTSNS